MACERKAEVVVAMLPNLRTNRDDFGWYLFGRGRYLMGMPFPLKFADFKMPANENHEEEEYA